ncbi:MAG: AMP-binding protein [Acidimicrobiales bacterium]
MWRERTWSWTEVTDRTRRFANVLVEHGIGRHGALAACAGWESPHDHVALYLQNGNAYLESQLGAAKAGAAAFNVNYRYVADELAYLLDDAGAAAIVYQGCFAATLGKVLGRLRRRPAAARGRRLGRRAAPRCGGLRGRPGRRLAGATSGGVVARRPLRALHGRHQAQRRACWRQADFLVAALGVRRKDRTDHESLDELVEDRSSPQPRHAPGAPAREVRHRRFSSAPGSVAARS